VTHRRFDGKHVVITGAGSGIGRATARRLCEEGADVLGLDISTQGLEETFDGHPEGHWLALDLARPESVQAIATLAGADALVNAAGILRRHPILEHPLDEWEQTMAVNLVAPYRLCRAFARGHVEHPRAGGAIVNVCSIESFTGAPGHAAYTASKGGMLMLTKAFALELAARGIRVNGIAPGITATGMNESLRADPVRSAQLLQAIPMQRFGHPQDQAAAICFLLSDEAAYITGAVLAVDGGWLAM